MARRIQNWHVVDGDDAKGGARAALFQKAHGQLADGDLHGVCHRLFRSHLRVVMGHAAM